MGRSGKSKRGGFFACCLPSSPDDMGVVPMQTEFEPPQIKTRKETTAFVNEATDVTEEESVPEEDPCEQAYRLWYEKGMLSFVPKSILEEDARREQMKIVPPPRDSPIRPRNSNRHSPPRVPAAKPRATLARSAPVVREEPQVQGPPKVTRKSLGIQKVRREERPRAVVQPPSSTDEPWTAFASQPAFESSPTTKYNTENRSPKKNSYRPSSPSKKPKKPCSSCGQTSNLPLVRCQGCGLTYCSVFCRGNDRYTHNCPANVSPRRSTSQTTPVSTSSSRSSSNPAVQFWEQKSKSSSWKHQNRFNDFPDTEKIEQYWENDP